MTGTEGAVDRAKRLLAGITPGPWVAMDLGNKVFTSANHKGWWWVWQADAFCYSGVFQVDHKYEDEPGEKIAGSSIGVASITDAQDGEQERRDAEFIAAAPDLVAGLLAEHKSNLDAADRAAGYLRVHRDDPAVIERIAKVIYGSEGFTDSMLWDNRDDLAKQWYLDLARAVLSALEQTT